MGAYEVMVEFVTNGMHLDEELCQVLVANKVRKIHVSFSGATKEEYENIYLGGVFDKVLSGLAALKRAKEAAGSTYPIVATNTIAMPHVVEKLPQFVDLVGTLGVSMIQLFGLAIHVPELYPYSAVYNPLKHRQIFDEAFRRAKRHGLELCVDNFVRQSAQDAAGEREVKLSRLGSGLTASQVEGELLQIDVGAMKKYARQHKASAATAGEARRPVDPASAEHQLNEKRLRISPVTLPNRENLFCMEPFRTMYVRRDGRTKPCCLWPADNEHFGSLARDDGHAIWNNDSFTSTRRAIVQGLYPDNCHYCIKSLMAPTHSQLSIIGEYIDWYHVAYGVKLPVTPPALRTNPEIVSSLARLAGFQQPVIQVPTAADPPFLDWRYYLDSYSDLRAAGLTTQAQAQNHWLTHGIDEGRRGSDRFWAAEYLRMYPDLAAAFGPTNYAAAIRHYRIFGMDEGRRGTVFLHPAVFDWRYYVQSGADPAAAGITTEDAAAAHWLEHGIRAGRQGSATFRPPDYLGRYPDVHAALGPDPYAAIRHYVLHGMAEGRLGLLTVSAAA
jgi:MoaA/NifB/PqqE/SkfB family radical SAM enzyme